MQQKTNFAVRVIGIGFLLGALYCVLMPVAFGPFRPMYPHATAIGCALVGIGCLLARPLIVLGFLRAVSKAHYWIGTILTAGLAGGTEACMHAAGIPHPEGVGVPFTVALVAWLTAWWGWRRKP